MVTMKAMVLYHSLWCGVPVGGIDYLKGHHEDYLRTTRSVCPGRAFFADPLKCLKAMTTVTSEKHERQSTQDPVAAVRNKAHG